MKVFHMLLLSVGVFLTVLKMTGTLDHVSWGWILMPFAADAGMLVSLLIVSYRTVKIMGVDQVRDFLDKADKDDN